MGEQRIRCDPEHGRDYCCGGQATSPHPCPYAEEINDDSETLCTCCEACERECCDDI